MACTKMGGCFFGGIFFVSISFSCRKWGGGHIFLAWTGVFCCKNTVQSRVVLLGREDLLGNCVWASKRWFFSDNTEGRKKQVSPSLFWRHSFCEWSISESNPWKAGGGGSGREDSEARGEGRQERSEHWGATSKYVFFSRGITFFVSSFLKEIHFLGLRRRRGGGGGAGYYAKARKLL